VPNYLASVIGYAPVETDDCVFASGVVLGSDRAREWAIYLFSHPRSVVQSLRPSDIENLQDFYTSLIPLPWSEEYLMLTYFEYIYDHPFQFTCPWILEAESASVLALAVEKQVLEIDGSMTSAGQSNDSFQEFLKMWEGPSASEAEIRQSGQHRRPDQNGGLPDHGG
jgi:hypothetical protein